MTILAYEGYQFGVILKVPHFEIHSVFISNNSCCLIFIYFKIVVWIRIRIVIWLVETILAIGCCIHLG